MHHRLVRLGHGPRRTVVILWTWTAVLSGFVLFPLSRPESNAIIPFVVIVLGLLLFTLFHPGLRNGRREEARGVRPTPAHDRRRAGDRASNAAPSARGLLRIESILRPSRSGATASHREPCSVRRTGVERGRPRAATETALS